MLRVRARLIRMLRVRARLIRMLRVGPPLIRMLQVGPRLAGRLRARPRLVGRAVRPGLATGPRAALAGAHAAQAAAAVLALLLLVAPRIVDEAEHFAGAARFARVDVGAGELAVGGELPLFVELPHLFRVGQPRRAGDEALEEAVQVVDVAQKHLARVGVARGVHRLREVDDHRAVGGHQHVEVGEVAVHHAGGEHARDLGDQLAEDLLRLFWRELEIAQARRRLAVRVRDQLHDQHAVDEIERLGHADAGALQSIDHIDFGRLPRLFVLRLAVLGALGHRALVSAGADLAALHIFGAVLEIAVLRLFVDLGDAPLAAGRDDEDVGLFSALQRPRDLVDHSVLDERGKPVGNAHCSFRLLLSCGRPLRAARLPIFSPIWRGGARTIQKEGTRRSKGATYSAMQLGIDFGTTHTVVALVDRGNFPVVPFGEADVIPSLAAAHEDGRLVFGADAAQVAHSEGWTLLRSMKRLLHTAGPKSEVALGPYRFLVRELVARFLEHVRERLCEQLQIPPGEGLQAAISVPANASSAQRMITVDAFREAGFDVMRLLNEPSAAACEYAHRFARTVSSKREHVLVYDLGGGTFDASVLRLDDQGGEVVGSAGVSRLGGDDFDQTILALALERSELREAALGALDPDLRARMLDECRLQKEAVNPSTRKLAIDLSALLRGGPQGESAAKSEAGRDSLRGSVVLPADEVYAACTPLVAQSLEAMDEALRDAHGGAGVSESELAGIYVVGGASSFPPVYRTLRERFGQGRVRRSPHPFGSCAIGLAIHLADGQTRTLAEKLTRHFGVFREARGGEQIACDVLLAKDTPLPLAGEKPIEVKRRYRAAHNVGHFRFFECARLQAGRPEGNLALWDELRFPFDPRLREVGDLSRIEVERTESGPEIEEVIRYSAGGEVEVELRVLADGYSRTSRIAQR